MRACLLKGRFLLLSTAVLSAGLGLVPAFSSRASADTEGDAVVARVGDATVNASTIKKALSGVPAFELQALGTTRFDILRKYVDEAIVREELLAQAAKNRNALADHSVQLHLRKAMASALVRHELTALGTRESIPAAEVKAYYDAHGDEYRSPERLRLWHLVVATKADAEAALAKVKADPTREAWPKIVSDLSLDPNTKRSSGDLGFVSADGRTTEPKVIVPKELVTAAFALKDGQLADAPVQTSAGWHVLWRRGSVPATARTLTEESPTIRELLFEQKRQNTYNALIARLRGGSKVEIDEELIPLVNLEVGPRPIPKTRK